MTVDEQYGQRRSAGVICAWSKRAQDEDLWLGINNFKLQLSCLHFTVAEELRSVYAHIFKIASPSPSNCSLIQHLI